jgi:signal transduction histidine kinase
VIRVVLADDTADIRLLVRMALQRDAGFEVVGEASDGVEAVALTTATQPDVVLLDLAMPRLDGLQAIPLIRDAAPDTKIVVLSAFVAGQMGDEATQAGAHAYVEKGTPGVEIVEAIRHVVGKPARVDATQPSAPAGAPPEEQVLAALVHELSTPVTAVEGFAELLDVPLAELPEHTFRPAIEAIRRNANHLRGLLNAFADARRIDVDALDLHIDTTDFGKLVDETVSSLTGVVAPHPLHVRVHSTAMVPLDAVRVRQAVINLVRNAAKFSDPEAPVEVDVDVIDGRAQAVVTDYGIGIPEEQREHLFGKFVQLSRGPGTGLGLYISRGIARAHGGDLVLEASSSAGSRFALRLPVGSPSDEQ